MYNEGESTNQRQSTSEQDHSILQGVNILPTVVFGRLLLGIETNGNETFTVCSSRAGQFALV